MDTCLRNDDKNLLAAMRPERSDMLLRVEFVFPGMPVLHGTTGNAAFGGLLANCSGNPCKEAIGKQGFCRIFLGLDFFEIPCQVMRVVGSGLGIHLLRGHDQEFNQVVGHMQHCDSPLPSLSMDEPS